jgi:glycine betaine/choline ABC-type transport system substrate-binding protein
MKKISGITIILTLIGIMLVTGLAGCGSDQPDIIVGGKNFSEQYIMAEMLSILIEDNTDLSTDLTLNLAGSVIDDAIKVGDIDLYLEYTGTALINLGLEPGGSSEEVYETVKREYDQQLNIKWMKPYGFNNTYAMVVTRDTAEEYNLESISDLTAVADQMILGCTHVFTERNDGYPGLSRHYGFEFADVKGMDPSIMYQAVVEGSVDVISAFATEGRIAAFDLVILEDDQKFFPPYDATTIIRGDTLEEHPELEDLLNKLAGRIDDNTMAALNAQVDLDKREPADVAREFLEQQGLI